MKEHIPGFNRECLTIQGAETHKEPLLQLGGPRQESWSKRPPAQLPKLLANGNAQVTLRKKPITKIHHHPTWWHLV